MATESTSAMIEQAEVKISDLHEPPNNPRRGNLEVIKESLQTHGQYRTIVVNKRDNSILAGNHTVKAARDLGWESIVVNYVDVDQENADKILAIDNRSNDLAEYDQEALSQLLQNLDDLEGTGYDADDLEELRRLTGELADEAMAELDAALGQRAEVEGPPSKRPQFQFILSFSVTATERATVMAALRHMIERDDTLMNSNDALLKLISSYIEDEGVEVKMPELEG